MMSIAGKNAVITGASQGIGEAIAARLFEVGANLALIGRDFQRLETLVGTFARRSTPAPLLIEADLMDPVRLADAADQIATSFSMVDILINCGGAYLRVPWDEPTPDAFNNLMRTNVTGPYALTRALLPHLVSARGDVVFVNSSIIRSPGLSTGHYKATKHALQALTDSLRSEVNEKGIRVLSIYPGRTATPLQEYIHKDEERAYVPERLLQPSDVADMVFSCLSLPETAEVTDLYIRPRFRS